VPDYAKALLLAAFAVIPLLLTATFGALDPANPVNCHIDRQSRDYRALCDLRTSTDCFDRTPRASSVLGTSFIGGHVFVLGATTRSEPRGVHRAGAVHSPDCLPTWLCNSTDERPRATIRDYTGPGRRMAGLFPAPQSRPSAIQALCRE